MPPGPPLLKPPTGATKVAAVIGDPVRHSLSPVLHNAAFAAMDLDWVYVAFPVRAGEGAKAVQALRTFGLGGLSVTMPHKQAVAAAVDRLSPTAQRLGVVNTVGQVAGEVVGDCTDGPGFVDALREETGFDPAGHRAIVLGAGGAARAVTVALVERGATVGVIGRRPETVAACVRVAGRGARAASLGEVDTADLVVNATPVGMGGSGEQGSAGGLPLGVDPHQLGPGQLVADLVYRPTETALLAAARRRGATTTNGLGMLVHQAARQLVLWTGQSAPIGVMAAAAQAALAGVED